MSRIAVFTSGKRGICVTRDAITFSKVYDGSIEAAAIAFAKDVPPDSVCATYTQRNRDCNLPTLQSLVPALQAAGYKNINTYSTVSCHASIALNVASLKCKVGDLLVLMYGRDSWDPFVLVEKTAAGYKLNDINERLIDDMNDKDLQVKHFIVELDDGATEEEVRAKLTVDIVNYENVDFRFHSFNFDDHLSDFIWNKYDGGNFNGNLLADTALMSVSFAYFKKSVALDVTYAILPYKRTFRVDIFDADKFDPLVNCYDNPELLEEIDFDPSKRRVIDATVFIGLDHIPKVKVTTVECEIPRDLPICRPEGKNLKPTALLVMPSDKDVMLYVSQKYTKSKKFADYSELLPYLQAHYPPHAVDFVLEQYPNTLNLKKRRECHLFIQKAGYTNILAKSFQFYSWMLRLHRYKVDIPDGETVAFYETFKICGVLARQGRTFRVIYTQTHQSPAEMFRLHQVRTVIADPNLWTEYDIDVLGDSFVILQDCTKENNFNVRTLIWNLADGLDFDGYLIEDTLFVVFNVCFNGKIKTFETGFVPIPYEWTVELDVEDASSIQVNAKLFYFDTIETEFNEVNSFDAAKIGSHKVAITFCINSAYHVAARCVPLPSGRTPRPISLCLWIERTDNGFQKTVYFRDSGKTVIDKCPNLYVALETFKQTEHTAIFFNVFLATAVECKEWHIDATNRGFKDIQFVNGPVLALNSILCDMDPVEFGDNETVLVGDMTAVDKNGQKAPMTYVLQSHQKKLKLQKIVTAKVDKVYSTLDSVDHVFVIVADSSNPPKVPQHLDPVFVRMSDASTSKYLFSRVDNISDSKSIVDDIAGVTFVAEWTGGKQVFDARFEAVPFSRDVALHVGPVKTLKIDTTHYNSKKRKFLKDVSFDMQCDRVVLLKLAVDSMMVPTVTVIRSDPLPSTVFEFTSDNRIVVHRNGLAGLEYPAYVSFGDSILVGKTALHQLKENPQYVVYDVHRFFSPDFDPTHPDPTWHFKTSRGKNNETTIHIGESTTTSTVCFGTIVSAVKRDVESKGNCTLTDIGIRMPSGIVVPEDVCLLIGGMLTVKLVVLA